jgi:hypothetical protein
MLLCIFVIMGKVSHKICWKNQNLYFKFSNFFLKILPSKRYCRDSQNLVLCFHCNMGYANASQFYVMRLFICYCRLQIRRFLKGFLASITDVVFNASKKSRDTSVQGKGC